VAGSSWYILEVYNTSDALLQSKWVSASTYCTGTSCSYVIPNHNLPNGSYKWRVRNVINNGYGPYSGFTTFTLDIPACYLLNLVANPAGAGTIAANIPQNCAGGYTVGTVVQLTASPASGYGFQNWSGSVSGATNPVSVTMNANKTVYANFVAGLTTGLPNGLMTSWDKSYNWTGVEGSTWYILEVYNTADTLLQSKWISASTYCTGTSCSYVIPNHNLPNGDYKWRVRNVRNGAYGPYTAFTSFTLNIGGSGAGIVLGSPSGTVNASTWNKSYNWTGVAGSSWYILEVYNTADTLLQSKWISASTYCTGTSCSYVIPNHNLPNGSYRWRVRNVINNGYGPYSVLQDFTIVP
jgi:hypothetical protein